MTSILGLGFNIAFQDYLKYGQLEYECITRAKISIYFNNAIRIKNLSSPNSKIFTLNNRQVLLKNIIF